MITLKHDSLSITFPKIARQVRLIVERQIQKIASELPPPCDRAELVSQIESSRDFHKLSPAAQENARAKLNTWTPAHVEAALREAILNRGGLNTDTFTELTIKFQRTMRIPNDGRTSPTPVSFGCSTTSEVMERRPRSLRVVMREEERSSERHGRKQTFTDYLLPA